MAAPENAARNPASNASNSARAAFAHRAFVFFQVARFCIVVSTEMQSVAVGWQVYEITRRPLDLGYVGLAQFAPGILLFLVSGHLADRYDRRKLITFCYLCYGLGSATLLVLAMQGIRSVYPIYGVLIFLGVIRSLGGPVGRALLPQLVPPQDFVNAVSWASSIFQWAVILGPSVGGVVYAAFRGPTAVYGLAVAGAAAAVFATLRVRTQSPPRPREPVSMETVLAGFRYIWRQKLILGSISLDLFAVLLGGAVALLPVYAREILHTGPWGLGILRSAPALGAAVMAIFIAYRPLRRKAGRVMLLCVAGFGVATIIFGLSRSLVLSLVALFLVGATDMVSVIVRQTLVQLATPDEMRGRVSAVDMVFIGASNELGQFESGVTAHWFGTVPAVVLGGIGALAVTGLWAWIFPELRRADRLAAPPTT